MRTGVALDRPPQPQSDEPKAENGEHKQRCKICGKHGRPKTHRPTGHQTTKTAVVKSRRLYLYTLVVVASSRAAAPIHVSSSLLNIRSKDSPICQSAHPSLCTRFSKPKKTASPSTAAPDRTVSVGGRCGSWTAGCVHRFIFGQRMKENTKKKKQKSTKFSE